MNHLTTSIVQSSVPGATPMCLDDSLNSASHPSVIRADNIFYLPSQQSVNSAFTDLAIVLSMCMLSFIFVIVSGLFEWKRIRAGFFIVCLYLCCRWEIQLSRGKGWDLCIYSRRSSYQEWRVGICVYIVGNPVSRGEGWNLINWFNLTTFLCLSIATNFTSTLLNIDHKVRKMHLNQRLTGACNHSPGFQFDI